MKILITGDRHWTDHLSMDVMLGGFLALHIAQGDEVMVVLHGDAKGADSLAETWRPVEGIDVRAFPADWSRYPRAAGPIRNRQMLDEKPDLVIAFHDYLDASKGTKDCVAQALRRGIPVWHLRHVIADGDGVSSLPLS